MRTFLVVMTAALAFAGLSNPANAQKLDPIFIERIKDKDDVVLDPTKTYLLIEGDVPTITNLIRVPTEDELATWEAQRSEELAEAIERYPERLSSYERRLERFNEGNSRRSRPVAPVDPEESFPWPDIERNRTFGIGPLNRFAKQGQKSLYLHEVDPGEYIFYGVGLLGYNECMCMGTVSFTVEPEAVTLIRVTVQPVDEKGNFIAEHPDGLSSTDMFTRFGIALSQPTDFAYDPRIPREMIRNAEYSVVGRLTNWFGGKINRVMPIEGVIDYDRDRIIDVKYEEEMRALAKAEADAAEAAEAAAEAAAEVEAAAEAEAEAEPASGEATKG